MHERPEADEWGERNRERPNEAPDTTLPDELPTAPLTDERRRFVVSDLLEHYHPVPAYDLADRLRAWEDANGETISFDEVRRQLVEDHLPRLEREGLVESVSGHGGYVPSSRVLDVELSRRSIDRPAEE